MKNIKVAIVHDWLTGMRGGEKCLEVFCELFPDATLFTLIHRKGKVSSIIENMDIKTSFLQKIPSIFKTYRNFLPLFPFAIESFNLTGYGLILSSSHCIAKGVKSSPKALHICYCYTPMRYAWSFFNEYFQAVHPLKRSVIKKVIDGLKSWDIASNQRVDYFVAISDNVKNRIKKFYNRTADVIYPPVEVDFHTGGKRDEGFYLIVSALVPYKRIDIAVKAFNKSDKRLVVIGSGTEFNHLKKMSKDNIEFLEWTSDEKLQKHYSSCKALIFPGVEDFGIVPLEAQAYGKPVIAYAEGGVLETVIPFEGEYAQGGQYPTGVFFHEQTEDSLNAAIDKFEKNNHAFDPEKIRKNVTRFNKDRFKHEVYDYIKSKWQQHKND